MASYICIECKKTVFKFDSDMRVDKLDSGQLGNHEYWVIAKGNSIEGIEAK